MLFRQKVNLEKIATATIIINNAWKGILKAIRMLKLPAKYLCILILENSPKKARVLIG